MQKVQTHSQILEVDGQEYQVVHDDFEIEGDLEETEEYIEFDVVLAREMVQPYVKNGKKINVLKDGDELEKAAQYADTVHITDGHPSTGVVKRQTQKYGTVRDIEFDSDRSAITGRARVMKEWADDQFVQEILDEERTDVSIGFYAQYDRTSGDRDGEEYDAVQRNIVLDHLAIAPPEADGRCSSSDGCGIVENMADTVQDQLDDQDYDIAVNDPEDPEDVADDIRSLGYQVETRPCNCGDHEGHITILGEEDVEEDQIFPTHQPLGEYGTTESQEWDRPNFEDFDMEEGTFTDLSEEDKRFVAAHFGMLDAEDIGEATYSDLMLPHHDPGTGDVDRAGVIAGRQRLPQTEAAQEDLERIDRHLTQHLQEDFGDEEAETIFDWEDVQEGSEPAIRDRYLNQDDAFVLKEDTIGDQNMSNNDDDHIEDVTDLDMDDLRKNPEVQDLEDQIQDLEEQVSDLEDAKEQLDSIREEEAADLREELEEDFGIDEDRLEEKDLEQLQDLKETLDDAEIGSEEGDVTSTQTGADTGSDSKLIKPQSGPHADQYEEA